MRILFGNIAWTKEYRGNEDRNDTPLNGGSYVDETGDAHEKYNFFPIHPAHNFTTVVGWYKHATVFRHYQELEFGVGDFQSYNAIAKTKDCVLLPTSARSKILQWKVPRKTGGCAYGFGRANVWYASEDDKGLKEFLERLSSQIESYSGENMIRESE